MLYVASGRSFYVWVGLAFFAIGAVASYYAFGHVELRVSVWLDPWSQGLGDAYQIVLALLSYGLIAGDDGIWLIVVFASAPFVIYLVRDRLVQGEAGFQRNLQK